MPNEVRITAPCPACGADANWRGSWDGSTGQTHWNVIEGCECPEQETAE